MLRSLFTVALRLAVVGLLSACTSSREVPVPTPPTGSPPLAGATPTGTAPAPPPAVPVPARIAAEPKPLSSPVTKGLEWLIARQRPNGGWGQGEEAEGMRSTAGSQELVDKPNVADTSI